MKASLFSSYHLLDRIKKYVFALRHDKHFFYKLFFLLLLFIIFFTNTLHEKYPDEFDNILGGRYILQGILPYSGFFSHHGPIAYFVAAFIDIFSGTSFYKFRIFYSIALLSYLLITYLIIKKTIGETLSRFYLFFILIVGLGATYFWGHMLVADILSGYFIIPAYGILLLKSIYKKSLSVIDLYYISFFTFFALMSALTVIYLAAFLYIFALFYYFTSAQHKIISIKTLKPLAIFALPFVIFLFYLIVTGSLFDYVYQSIIFNQKYYIYNYPSSGGSGVNPIRYAIVIAHTFYNNYHGLLNQVRDFNLGAPFNISLAVANICLVIYLFLKKQYSLAALVFAALIYSNARSSPLDSSEKDYQSAVYILISLFNMYFLLPKLYSELNDHLEFGKKIVFSLLFLLLSFYSFFNALFLFGTFQQRAYDKYMGTAPLIYDRPVIAPILSTVINDNEYMWIGPLAFEELYYANGKLPSKYHMLIPGIGRSPKIQQEMLADFIKNKPKMIYFDKAFNILGSMPTEYGKFFLDFLDQNYITLYGYRDGKDMYASVTPVSKEIDLETKLYINKENKDEIINDLLTKNIIRKK